MQEKIIKKFADAWKVYNTTHEWFNCRKRPIIIQAIEMDTDFKVATKEGISLAGKKGDYLLKGIKGEVYPCNKQIFEQNLADEFIFISKLFLQCKQIRFSLFIRPCLSH